MSWSVSSTTRRRPSRSTSTPISIRGNLDTPPRIGVGRRFREARPLPEEPASQMTSERVRMGWVIPASLLVAGFVLLAYGPCLDNDFWRIDDQRHVANGAGFPFPNQYFRPGQELSFRLLWTIGGTNPLPYFCMGVLCHLAAALLMLVLTHRLFGSRLAAFVAALLFATLFAPHQAVVWMSAQEGVQEVVLSLAALLFWLRHLDRGGIPALVASFGFAAAAFCFRQSAVNLVPWMLAVQVWAHGPRDLWRPRRLLAWLPFILLAVLVTWRGCAGPGRRWNRARMEPPDSPPGPATALSGSPAFASRVLQMAVRWNRAPPHRRGRARRTRRGVNHLLPTPAWRRTARGRAAVHGASGSRAPARRAHGRAPRRARDHRRAQLLQRRSGVRPPAHRALPPGAGDLRPTQGARVPSLDSAHCLGDRERPCHPRHREAQV